MSESTTVDLSIPAGTWNVDPTHTRIGFVARHMMVTKIRGSFTDFSAEIEIADDPRASTLTAEVAMASVETGNDDRDTHLRTNDFFDVEHHPTMTLSSTGFDVDGDRLVMHSQLTIKGITHPVDFDLDFDGVGVDPWGSTRAGFTATATIDRKNWGVEFNAPLETGGVLVGDKVVVELDVQLVKA